MFYLGNVNCRCLCGADQFKLGPIVTVGYKLPYKFIVHMHNPSTSEEDCRNVIEKCLTLVQSVKSVAFPLIGTGSYVI